MKQALYDAGIREVEQLVTFTSLQLSERCKGMSFDEAATILDLVTIREGEDFPVGVSGYELWKTMEEVAPETIPTFCQPLDELLGGGISVGVLTEIVGAPGAGKTQLCHQLAASVQLPQGLGGLDGRAMFIDTEGSFIAGRFREVAQATVAQLQKVVNQQGAAGHGTAARSAAEQLTVGKILGNSAYFRCYDVSELVALFNVLPEILKGDPCTRLLIVDSVAFHFRHSFDDMALRSRMLFQCSQALAALAKNFNVAVVVTNQMTSRMTSDDASAPELVPALGDSWAHGVGVRIVLSGDGEVRKATVEKSPTHPKGVAAFRIATKGIRSVV